MKKKLLVSMNFTKKIQRFKGKRDYSRDWC